MLMACLSILATGANLNIMIQFNVNKGAL